MFFARLTPHRSYCMAFDTPDDVARSMFISVDSPTRSVRWVGAVGSDRIRRQIDCRRGRSHRRPVPLTCQVDQRTDPMGRDALPRCGPDALLVGAGLPTGRRVALRRPVASQFENLLVATGFDKWGLTNGAAALALSSRILGGHTEWAEAFASWSRHELVGIPHTLRANLEVGINLATGWLKPLNPLSSLTEQVTTPEESGQISGPPWHLSASSNIDGSSRSVLPVCPHLGGIVRWNDADEAWECPLHGSRFAPDGTLLEGPTTRDLTRQPAMNCV